MMSLCEEQPKLKSLFAEKLDIRHFPCQVHENLWELTGVVVFPNSWINLFGETDESGHKSVSMIHLQTEMIQFSSSTHWLNDLVNKPLMEKIISEWPIC